MHDRWFDAVLENPKLYHVDPYLLDEIRREFKLKVKEEFEEMRGLSQLTYKEVNLKIDHAIEHKLDETIEQLLRDLSD